MTHFPTAALSAAAVGALLAAAVLAAMLANRRLAAPFPLRERDALAVAGTGLALGLLFAAMGARGVATVLGWPPWHALGLTLVGTWSLTTTGAILLTPVVGWYLRWSRTPAVLREYES